MTGGYAPEFPCLCRWRTRPAERSCQPCHIATRGTLNSVRVEFPDGFWVITSRWAVRRAAPAPGGDSEAGRR
jgi:hypothetical protein